MKSTFTILIIFLSLQAFPVENKLITANWNFQCKKEDYRYVGNYTSEELTRYLREYTKLSVLEGMGSLQVINPSLSVQVASELKKKINVTCEKLSGGTLGEANPFWGTLKIHTAALSNFISRYERDENLPLETMTGDSMIFHEILHHAKIDNFKVSIHNSPSTDKTADVVYACGSATFHKDFDGCIVCSLASKNNGSISLRNTPDEIEKSKEHCMRFMSEKYEDFRSPLISAISPEALDPKYYNNQKDKRKTSWGFSLPSNYSISIDLARIFGSSSSQTSVNEQDCASKYQFRKSEIERIQNDEISDEEEKIILIDIEYIRVKQIDIECRSLGENKINLIKERFGLSK